MPNSETPKPPRSHLAIAGFVAGVLTVILLILATR